MSSLFAVAGVAAAHALTDWGLLCLGITLTWGAAFFGLLLKSRAFAVISAAFWIFVTVPLRPWEAFLVPPFGGWEAEELVDDFRLIAWLWIGATVGTTTAILGAFRRRAYRTV